MKNNWIIPLLLVAILGQLLIVSGYIIFYLGLISGHEMSSNMLMHIFNPFSLIWIIALIVVAAMLRQ